MKDTKYHIGDIIGDSEIIDIHYSHEKHSTLYTLCCRICNRTKTVYKNYLESTKIYHSSCKTEIDKSNPIDNRFYQRWKKIKKDILKDANALAFVDFYDKYYKQFLEVENIAFQVEFKKVNNIYQFVPVKVHNAEKLSMMLHKFNMGDIIDDMEIIDTVRTKNNGYKYRVKCKICGTEKWARRKVFNEHICTTHQFCKVTNMDNIKDDPILNNFHMIWLGIRRRTTNPNSKDYANYGERGINSDEFKYFRNFYDVMYQPYLEAIKKWPNETISIDRIDVNGNYCEENCRWIPMKWQNNNQQRSKWKLLQNGDKKYLTKALTIFCKLFNLSYHLLNDRLHGKTKSPYKGWTIQYVDIEQYKDILFLNDVNAIIDITDINNPININPI